MSCSFQNWKTSWRRPARSTSDSTKSKSSKCLTVTVLQTSYSKQRSLTLLTHSRCNTSSSTRQRLPSSFTLRSRIVLRASFSMSSVRMTSRRTRTTSLGSKTCGIATLLRSKTMNWSSITTSSPVWQRNQLRLFQIFLTEAYLLLSNLWIFKLNKSLL